MSTFSSSSIGREAYRAIPRYTGDTGPIAIDLSDNTNWWGAPPAATAALRQTDAVLARYPEPYNETLKVALGRYVDVEPECIVTGCGSDDILDVTFRACGDPGARVSVADPTFVMGPIYAAANSLAVHRIPVLADGSADVERLASEPAAVVYVCSPNNPTGVPVPRADLERIVAAARGVVIVDEAYAEYAGTSVADLVKRYDNLVVARTFSKAFGLAGLRIGYAIASRRLAQELEKARGPYKLGTLSALAATTALEHDMAWVSEHVASANANRARLIDALSALGLRPYPSAANFVLAPVRDASACDRALRARGIAVRAFKNLATIGDAVRITVGPWGMLEATLAALDATRAEWS